MGKTFLLSIVSILSLGIFISGGYQQEGLGTLAYASESAPRRALQIVVPNNVKSHWQSVEISIFDIKINAEKTYSINIGETFQVPDTPLHLEIETFLPSFIISGSQITSESNDTHNPAVYVNITEGQERIFSGWLFSLYPDAHAFQNTHYNFNLTGYIAKN
jgi:hypothetical protein